MQRKPGDQMRRRVEYAVLLLIAVGVANLVLLGFLRDGDEAPILDTPPEAVTVSTTEPFVPQEVDASKGAERIAARSTTTTVTSPPRTFPKPTFVAGQSQPQP